MIPRGRGRGNKPVTALNKHRRLLVEQKLSEREFPQDEVSVPASFASQLENKEREPGWRQEFGGGDSCRPPPSSRRPVSNCATLFASIASPGQILAPPEPPALAPESDGRLAYEAALAAGCEVGGVTYGITGKDQLAWTAALTALDNAQALGAFDPSVTPVEAALGPILDIEGRPVPSMTVIGFRQTMLALVQRIGQIRAQYAGAAKATAWREWVCTTLRIPPKAMNCRRCVGVSDEGRRDPSTTLPSKSSATVSSAFIVA